MPANTTDKGSSGTNEKTPESSDGQMTQKSNKAGTPLAPRPKVEIARFDAAA
jgi:hypothetical protein